MMSSDKIDPCPGMGKNLLLLPPLSLRVVGSMSSPSHQTKHKGPICCRFVHVKDLTSTEKTLPWQNSAEIQFHLRQELIQSATACLSRPDMTFAVDSALKPIIYLSVCFPQVEKQHELPMGKFPLGQ